MDIEFANKEFFWLLLIIPVSILWYWFKALPTHPKVNYSTTSFVQMGSTSWKLYLKHFFFSLRLLAIAGIIAALARPQSSTSWQDVTTEGIDIVIALDISGSMLAEDFKPNRLEASKEVALDFISGRPNDRVGLVIYSGESFTQCPITTDHDVLKNLFKDVKNGMIEDGTAIGNGLATAASRLKDSDAISKVVILLTDGSNNAGNIPPVTAAEIAKTFGIRVYTVGVGTNGLAPYPFKNPFGGITYQDIEVKIDEETLQEIADLTDGKYFRATDNQKLKEIYKEIDQLEKSKINVTEFRKRNEEFKPWLLAAVGLLLLDFLGRIVLLKGIV